MNPLLDQDSWPGGIYLILTLIGLWKVFEKAGRPGWEALIPFYNLYVIIKIVGKPWWWIFLFFIPVVSFVMLVWVANLLAKSFGQNVLFTFGLVLLSPVFLLILGFGNFNYLGPAGAEERAMDPEELV